MFKSLWICYHDINLNFESRNFINKTIERVQTKYYSWTVWNLRRVKSFYNTLYLDKDAELTAVDIDNITNSSYVKKTSHIWTYIQSSGEKHCRKF